MPFQGKKYLRIHSNKEQKSLAVLGGTNTWTGNRLFAEEDLALFQGELALRAGIDTLGWEQDLRGTIGPARRVTGRRDRYSLRGNKYPRKVPHF
jgi:hypothetical protein